MKREIHVLHSLPNAFLAPVGKYLVCEGITEAQAIKLVQERQVQSYVRHASIAKTLTARLGVAIPPDGGACPNPFDGKVLVLVCSASWILEEMTGEDIVYQLVYDGTPGILEAGVNF